MSDRAPSDCLLRSWMLRNIHEQKRRNCLARSDNQKCQHFIFIRLVRPEILFIISHVHKSIHDKKTKPPVSLSHRKTFAGNMHMARVESVNVTKEYIYSKYCKCS